MNYYKVKVKHKKYDHIERWFYLFGVSEQEALGRLEKSCKNSNLSYHPCIETVVGVTSDEFFTNLSKVHDYN